MASAPEAVPVVASRWDPIQVLRINQKQDGNFTCAGVTAAGTPCGWNIRGPSAANIQNLADTLSMQPPVSAIQSLRILAEAVICFNHKKQISIKVRSWTAAINNLPAQNLPTHNLPASRPVQNLTPPLSQQSSISTSTLSFPHYEANTPTSSGTYSEYTTSQPQRRTTLDPWKKIEDLEEHIENLTKRLEALEAGSPSMFSRLRKSK
jgi:hypothetical protein